MQRCENNMAAPEDRRPAKKDMTEMKNLDNRRLAGVHLTFEINVSRHLSILARHDRAFGRWFAGTARSRRIGGLKL